MTREEIHDILTENDFKLLDKCVKSAFYRKIYPNPKFRWYMEVIFEGDQVLSINGRDPEETIKKLDRLQ